MTINISLGIISYLLGSIPFGLIISKLKNIDIREHGSGNIGATNVTRTIGKKLGIVTFILDGLKGILALYIAYLFKANDSMILLSSLLSIMGHIFPIWLKFKGGKGVATAIVVIFALNIKLGLLLIAIWILVYKASKIVSVASIAVFLVMPIYSYLFTDQKFFIFSLAVSSLVILRHSSNIKNLLAGIERKFK